VSSAEGELSVQSRPSLRRNLPLITLLGERKCEDSGPTATLALEYEGERRGKDDVGVCADHGGVNDFVARDSLVGNIEIVRPFLCDSEPAALSIRACPAVWTDSIDDDNFTAESAVIPVEALRGWDRKIRLQVKLELHLGEQPWGRAEHRKVHQNRFGCHTTAVLSLQNVHFSAN